MAIPEPPELDPLDEFDGRQAKLGKSVNSPLETKLAEALREERRRNAVIEEAAGSFPPPMPPIT